MWNSLPQHFRDNTSYNDFKNLMNAWSGVSFVQIFKCVCFMLQFNSSYAVYNLLVSSVYGSTTSVNIGISSGRYHIISNASLVNNCIM